MNKIISIDPGSEKCGILLADTDSNFVLDGKVVLRCKVIGFIKKIFDENSIKLIIIGDGTNSKYWYAEIFSLNLAPIKFVEETGSTLKARDRYWEIYPPNFFLRFIPKSMLLPPKDLDAIAALILLENYLKRKIFWPDNIDFKISLEL